MRGPPVSAFVKCWENGRISLSSRCPRRCARTSWRAGRPSTERTPCFCACLTTRRARRSGWSKIRTRSSSTLQRRTAPRPAGHMAFPNSPQGTARRSRTASASPIRAAMPLDFSRSSIRSSRRAFFPRTIRSSVMPSAAIRGRARRGSRSTRQKTVPQITIRPACMRSRSLTSTCPKCRRCAA